MHVETYQFTLPKTQLPDAEIVRNLIHTRDALWKELKGKPMGASSIEEKLFFKLNSMLYTKRPLTDAERIKELEDRVAELEKCT